MTLRVIRLFQAIENKGSLKIKIGVSAGLARAPGEVGLTQVIYKKRKILLSLLYTVILGLGGTSGTTVSIRINDLRTFHNLIFQ